LIEVAALIADSHARTVVANVKFRRFGTERSIAGLVDDFVVNAGLDDPLASFRAYETAAIRTLDVEFRVAQSIVAKGRPYLRTAVTIAVLKRARRIFDTTGAIITAVELLWIVAVVQDVALIAVNLLSVAELVGVVLAVRLGGQALRFGGVVFVATANQ